MTPVNHAKPTSEHLEAVRRYIVTAWPVSSTTRGGCVRKAWGESRLPNIGLEQFKAALLRFGWKPVPVGEMWFLKFRNDEAQRIKCEGAG